MSINRYFKLLVTGGRHYNNTRFVYNVLDSVLQKYKMTPDRVLLVHGRATGADSLARSWAREREIPDIGIPARWSAEGNRAGTARNQLMLDMLNPHIVVAFPGGLGTAHMMALAKSSNYEVIEATRWLNA